MENLTQKIEALFTNMENFTQKEGFIAKSVTHSDKIFLPIISVILGYGGGDSQTKNQDQANASGASKFMGSGAVDLGAKLSTNAVLVIDKGNILITYIGFQGSVSQIIDKVPQIIGNMTSSGQQQNQ